jgi:putative redox protein
MVKITIAYQGGLRCKATHTPSKSSFLTDAPVDNQGQGEAFSPTDLVATALGTCMLTTMGIVAQRHDWSLEGASASVIKEMVADPVRRIGRLRVVIELPSALESKAREALERAAHTCPVHQSLSASVDIPVEFRWGAA